MDYRTELPSQSSRLASSLFWPRPNSPYFGQLPSRRERKFLGEPIFRGMTPYILKAPLINNDLGYLKGLVWYSRLSSSGIWVFRRYFELIRFESFFFHHLDNKRTRFLIGKTCRQEIILTALAFLRTRHLLLRLPWLGTITIILRGKFTHQLTKEHNESLAKNILIVW